MNPYYYGALKQAKKCSENNIKISEDFINNYTDKTKKQEEIQEVKDNLRRLNLFIDYAKTDNAFKYLNALEMLNIGEDTISQIYALLFNVKNENNKEIKKTKREFCISFLKLIQQNEAKENNEKKFVLQTYDEKEIELLAENMCCEQGENNYDILLISETEKRKFVCVIENKKNAALSCTRREEGANKEITYRTQIERYWKQIDLDKTCDKKFIFLHHGDGGYYLDTQVKNHLKFSNKPKKIENGKYWSMQECIDVTKIDDEKLNKQTVRDLLNKYNYTEVYHSDTILELYKVLYDKEISNLFNNKVLNSTENFDNMFKTIDYYLDFASGCKSMEIARKIFGKEDGNLKEFLKDKYSSNNITYIEAIIQDAPNWESFKSKFPDFYNSKNKINIRGNSKINFFKKNIEYNEFINLLRNFIEYWELHYDYGSSRDNVEGYSKIIDGRYLFEICEQLNKNEDLTKNIKFPNEIKKIIKEATFYKITDKIKEVLSNNYFRNIRTLDDLLWQNNFMGKIQEYNFLNNNFSNDAKYIYWNNHIVLFNYGLSAIDEFYMYYDVNKDEILIKNKKNNDETIVKIDNPTIFNIEDKLSGVKNYFKKKFPNDIFTDIAGEGEYIKPHETNEIVFLPKGINNNIKEKLKFGKDENKLGGYITSLYFEKLPKNKIGFGINLQSCKSENNQRRNDLLESLGKEFDGKFISNKDWDYMQLKTYSINRQECEIKQKIESFINDYCEVINSLKFE